VELAHVVGHEDAKAFKIVLVRNGSSASALADLLVRSHGIPKKSITLLGYVASDEQNAALLLKRNPIVIVPADILAHRPCLFYPPRGTVQAAIIQGTAVPAQVRRQVCSEEPFTIS
jgi:hypothetical protein